MSGQEDLLAKIIIACIGVIGGILLRAITIILKERLNRPKAKEPIDSAFDRLERLANRVQKENDDLAEENDKLRRENTNLLIKNAQQANELRALGKVVE